MKNSQCITFLLIILLSTEAFCGLTADPDSFDIITKEGCLEERTLVINNDGQVKLDYLLRTRSIQTREMVLEKIISEDVVISSIPSEFDFTVAENVPYKPGELLVRFGNKRTRRLIDTSTKMETLSSLRGASLIRDFQIVPGLSVVKLPEGVSVEEALIQFNQSEDVIYAQPNYELQILSTIPNDSRFGELWGMHNTGQSGAADADIDAPEAWDIMTGNGEVIVAVIDTGVDYTHTDLAANMWINEAEQSGTPGVDDDGNGYVDDIYGYDFYNNDGDPRDDHYHGTHCAGTIGAIGNNGQGVAGVCWNVKIMALKFLNSAGGGYTDDAIQAVQYSMLMGANLSSNSWGGGGYNQGLKDAIDAAGEAGMLFVAAAGNDGTNNDTRPQYPCSYSSESIISVMSTDSYDNKSGFSNYGMTTVDIGAPGSSILSCKPGNSYQYLSGTSMATPHVSGACALIWSMNPALSNAEVKDILLRTVDKTLSGKCVSEGRLNLYNAILETGSPWITFSQDQGSVDPGHFKELTVRFNAAELSPGSYEAEILILSNDPLSPTIVPVTMIVNPDDLQVSPADVFETSGTEGGPFTPVSKTYTLTNIGTVSIRWDVNSSEDWLIAEPATGVLGPMETINVNVSLAAGTESLEPNVYKSEIVFRNLSSVSSKQRSASLTVKPPDYFTEIFEGNNDITNKIFTFIPSGSKAYYEACREKITEFPTDPTGGTNAALGDDDFVEVILNNDKQILFYGASYDRFYIGSNGYITFEEPDTDFSGTLESHFFIPRISGIFTDLSPANSQNISYKQLDDRVAVTFKNVPVFGDKTKLSSFQIEMFFADGTICISYIGISANNFVAGLSTGRGLPPAFYLASDLSEYPICWPLGDIDKDYTINFEDFAMLASHWLENGCDIPYWCGKSDMDLSGQTDIDDLTFITDDWLYVKNWWLQPRSHWKFDDGSGNIALDSGDGSHNGTIIGAQWSQGQDAGALDFDAINDYVDFGDIDEFEFDDADFTIAFWFKTEGPHNIGAYQDGIGMILSKYNFTIGRQWFFQQLADGRVGFATYYSQSNGEGITSTNSYVGQWVHCVGVKRGTKKYLYFNGAVDVNGPCQGVQTGRTTKVMAGAIFNYEDGIYYQLFNGKMDDIRIYNRALTDAEVEQIYNETRTQKATQPVPADGEINVSIIQDLGWLAGPSAISHDVYFGTTNPPPFVINQTGSTFDTGEMATETTYFWRIDENTSSGVVTGDTWSFITAPPLPEPAYNPLPEDGAEDISINQEISWNAGIGAQSHDVYFGTVNPPPFICNQTETTYNAGTLEPFITYYWRIDEKNSAGTTPGTIWSFSTICQLPGYASNPLPEDGSMNLDPNNINLEWTAGAFALSHDVYFGTSYAAVSQAHYFSPEFKGNYISPGYSPGNLDVNTTYYWRIDERNNCSTIKGRIWNFKTWPQVILAPPRSWWNFDEGSGSTAYDTGTGGHNGAIVGAQWAEGQVGGALDFDAAGDYVNYGDIDEFEFGNNDFTVSFWFKTEGTHDAGGDQTGSGIIVAKYSFISGRQWFFQQAANGTIGFATYYTQNDGEGISTTNSYTGQWVHCVGVRQGAKKYMYINGVEDVNGPCHGVQTGKSTKVLVGAIHSSDTHYYQFFNGKIDSVRIYQKALTGSEVWQLYNSELNN